MGRRASLIGVLVPFMLSAYAVFSISMVVNQLSEALAASRPLVLWAIPIDFIGGAVGGLLIGHLADRAGRRKALYLAGLTFSLAVLLASSIRELWQLYLAWFFVGFGV
ncbi:MAG: MFS transporter, partial [Acidilobus sp.]